MTVQNVHTIVPTQNEMFEKIDQGEVAEGDILAFINRKFEINPTHLKQTEENPTQDLDNVDLQDLVRMVDELAVDPKERALIRPFTELLNNVLTQTPAVFSQKFLTPEELAAFYDRLQKRLACIALGLPKIEDVATKKAWLLDLAKVAENHGPARWTAEAQQICAMLNMVLESHEKKSIEDLTFEHLQEVRAEKLAKLGPNDVHSQKHIFRTMGKIAGIRGAEELQRTDDPYLQIQSSFLELFKGFNDLYTPYVVFKGVTTVLESQAKKDPEMLANWFSSHHMAYKQGEKIKTAAIVLFACKSGILIEKK